MRQYNLIHFIIQMRRKSTKPKKDRNSENQSQSQLNISQIYDQDTAEDLNKDYVEEKRKKKKKQYVSTSNDMFDLADQQVLDIKRGDQFVREHIRPHFLKRWDSDSNTLELRPDQLDTLSPMMRIYWQFKSRNMKCIIFVQFGKMEFLAFEDDAITLHQIFKKPLKKFSSFLMVNFWCKEIQLAKIQLFERKIPVLFLNQIQDLRYKEEHGLIKRQITQVITPSIFLNYQSKQFRQRIMLAIYSEKQKCGIVCIDVETNHFYIEQFNEKQEDGINNMHQIRRVLNKYRPAEVIVQRKDAIIKKIAKQICQPYIIQIPPMEGSLLYIIKCMNQTSEDHFFKRLLNLYNEQYKQVNNEQSKQFSLGPTVKALSMVLSYMKNFTLDAKIFGQGIFQFEHFESAKLKPMFDAQVYQNLQVFSLRDEPDSFGKPGTLYHYLNQCTTNGGQKLLKKWIDNPLRTVEELKQRQEAIKILMSSEDQVLETQVQLHRFSKLQKKVGDIYHWAILKREQGKIILTKQLKFDKDYDQSKNPAVIRLKQIYQTLEIFKDIQKFFKWFTKYDFDSKLLNKICKVEEVEDLYRISAKDLEKIQSLPSIDGLVSKLLSKIHYDREKQSIQPIEGMNQIFDLQKKQIADINEQLDQKLKQWKHKLDVSKASYVSVRARNEIEVPLAEVKGKKFKELIFSSQTAKFIRYLTAQINQLSQNLIIHEQALAKAYEPFCTMMVKQFCAHKLVWQLYLNALSKLDVLISLAKISKSMSPRTLPIFVQNKLSIVNGFHPGLIQIKKQQNIVGNTLTLNKKQKMLLLTGPNMGGKSTLLRQTCLLAIVAQIGCFVPAEKYESIIFDQIFCRIGASDRIIQGKSTFYVELQQTKRIVDQATPDSLVIIDQLGRGTSTYDGMAIASAVLNYIIDQIECYTLFSTHYFPITERYKTNQQVVCKKIGYFFEGEHIKFTYKLEQGVAEKSFASQVANYVGISKQAIQLANRKAQEMQKVEQNKNKNEKAVENSNLLQEIKDFLIVRQQVQCENK